MFTVFQIKVDGTKANKEHINKDEIDTWVADHYLKYATIQVTSDLTGVTKTYTDNGEWYEEIATTKEDQ